MTLIFLVMMTVLDKLSVKRLEAIRYYLKSLQNSVLAHAHTASTDKEMARIDVESPSVCAPFMVAALI